MWEQQKVDLANMPLKPTKALQREAETLLAKAIIEKNAPFAIVTSPYLKACWALISSGRYSLPCPKTIVARIDDVYELLEAKVERHLRGQHVISFELDSWTRANKHLTAITSGDPASSLFLASFENAAADTAVNLADATYR
jgi:hypothetical protein